MKGMTKVKTTASDSWMKVLTFAVLCSVWAMVGVFVHVGNQSELDQQRLSWTGEQQVLSQRIAKYALAAANGDSEAFASLEESKRRFRDILASENNEFEASERYRHTPEFHAYGGLSKVWDGFSSSVTEVVNGQILVLSVAETASLTRQIMPELMQHTQGLVDKLVSNNASSAQIRQASHLSMLGQRIVNNINNVMSGDGAEAAAVAFAEDTGKFGAILEQMLRDGNDTSAVQGKLKKIALLFSQISDHVGTVVDNSAELVGIQNAVQDVSTRSEKLFDAADELQKAYAAAPANRLVSMELAYILGAVALVILFWMGFEKLRTQRNRNQVIESENLQNQEAIMRLLDEMGDLAQGDLTVNATVTEDFTGAIADSINATVGSLRGLVKTINDTSTQMSASVEEAEVVAQQLSEASSCQSQDIANATSIINEMAASMNTVSAEAGESAKVAMSSVEIAKKGGDKVQRNIVGMDSIREHIQETSKRIKRLGESSQEIGDIVELINDIAEQTNILALNASIQAAMAGEAGRGFAVVADEVQRLAERSANATRQIEALVKAIQADTNEAVISMEKSTSGVVDGAHLAEDAGSALEEIENVSEQLAGLIQSISVSASKQAGTAAEISSNMNQIQDVTTQTASSTEKTFRSIGNLSRLAKDLDTSVAGFKLP
ncbi:MAG: type IV pili methyl-accepting chemotaxis transducer N-terminal domain-containing protein [Gammaproteobacteria bacterium]|nr:MAG: type IV pili methyl-accepting chemotaxis transducer N-terminal domain-containing protein [Gammaproteobacteria bacterium]